MTPSARSGGRRGSSSESQIDPTHHSVRRQLQDNWFRGSRIAGVRGDRSEGERGQKLCGYSLRTGLASCIEMARKYQRRRDRFRVNLTKATESPSPLRAKQPPVPVDRLVQTCLDP